MKLPDRLPPLAVDRDLMVVMCSFCRETRREDERHICWLYAFFMLSVAAMLGFIVLVAAVVR